jgi:N-methylcarbamate hydrolase
VFVLVGDKPIHASRRSAARYLQGVNKCWSQEKRFIKATEMDDALQAYAHVREAYQKILSESDVD